MATIDTVVQELVVNTLSHAQFKEAQEAGTLSPYELYGTPDTSFRLPVLTPMWFEHITDDVSWLRADTFSWHSGDVYIAAYNHLAGELSIALSTAQTDTIDGITITYYLAEDGHKICLPDQEANITALYEATGVAWYYLLDTDNKQFKLPRTKYGFVGLRDGVGNYVPESLPNITASFSNSAFSGASGKANQTSGAAYATDLGNSVYSGSGGGSTNSLATTNIDASLSSSAYQDNAPVQQRATQMYLYFYVGNFEQSAIEQTAGLNAELFNGKADVSRVEVLEGYDYVVESQSPTSDNGYTWYRKYKSGWVEQGGISESNKFPEILLPIPMQDTNYTVSLSSTGYGASGYDPCITNIRADTLTETGFTIQNKNHSGVSYAQQSHWRVCGMAA